LKQKKVAGKNETLYAKYRVSVCLVVFKLIKPKGWKDLYFVLRYIYLHFLTNHAVRGFKHNTCAFNPILNVTIFSCSVYTFRCL